MRFSTVEASRPRTENGAGDAAQVSPTGAALERLIRRRGLQHDAWVERAKAWEASPDRQPAGPVEFPRDEAAVIALGVPCFDCMVLVREQGEPGGVRAPDVAAELASVAVLLGDEQLAAVPAGGHVVTFGMVPGRHWAEFVVARCSR